MIEYAAALASTNGELLARLECGEAIPEGYWLVADRQTAGRGRKGREWHDGHGNFMGSTVVTLLPGDPPAQLLALLAGVALHATVTAEAPEARPLTLKWPNDLLLADRKLAGILAERRGESVVIGIGVNLSYAPVVPGRASAALADHAIPRDRFGEALADTFAEWLGRWHRASEAGWLIAAWKARAYPSGTLLTVEHPDHGRITGGFAGLDQAGALLLRLADGGVHVIHAGDVAILEEG